MASTVGSWSHIIFCDHYRTSAGRSMRGGHIIGTSTQYSYRMYPKKCCLKKVGISIFLCKVAHASWNQIWYGKAKIAKLKTIHHIKFPCNWHPPTKLAHENNSILQLVPIPPPAAAGLLLLLLLFCCCCSCTFSCCGSCSCCCCSFSFCCCCSCSFCSCCLLLLLLLLLLPPPAAPSAAAPAAASVPPAS